MSEIKTPEYRAEGIYFGLDEDAYHADPALGSGSVREIEKCPMYYWEDSWMNPLRETKEETPALLFGRALHKLVLEGSAEFSKAYVQAPQRSDYPEAIVTADEIKDHLRRLGGKLTGAKAELAERLRTIDPSVVLWDDVLAEHAIMCERMKATTLKGDVYARVVSAANHIVGDERVRAAFQGGRPEVSVFWEEEGVRVKARLDYLRLGSDNGRPLALVCDLKSYANVLDMPPERAVLRAIAMTRLDMQAALYLRGTAHVARFIREGKVFGVGGINPQWIETLASVSADDWRWYWCFYEKEAPIAMLRSTRPGAPMVQAGDMAVSRALATYKDYMATFGTNWRFVDPMPDTEVSETDLPKWLGN